MTTPDFLSSLDFLTDAQRDTLRGRDFDHPDAIAERPPAYFEGVPYNLSEGKASRLVGAARRAGAASPPATSTPTKIEVVTPDREKLIAEALRERPVRPQRLLDLGVTIVVERVAGEVDAEKTEHMRQFARGPVGATWHGGRVVRVDAIGAPTWINPRTGRSLQGAGEGGVDEVTLLPWGKLGEHGLRLTVFGEAQGFFRGMTDEAVLEAMSLDTKGQPTPLRDKVAARVEALGADLRDVVIRADRYEGPAVPVAPTVVMPPIDIPDYGIPLAQEGVRGLLRLVEDVFTPDEIRAIAADLPDGERIVNGLPGGNVNAAHLAYSFVDIVKRWNLVGRLLRDAMATRRSTRVAEIDRFFLGVAGKLTPAQPELHGRFASYLLSCFSAGELRRLVGYLPDGTAMVRAMPASSEPANTVAAGVVSTLDAHGYLDGRAGAALWDSLRSERPRRADEINQWQAALRGGR